MSVIATPSLPLVLGLEGRPPWDTPLQPVEYLEWINTFINPIKSASGLDIPLNGRKSYLPES